MKIEHGRVVGGAGRGLRYRWSAVPEPDAMTFETYFLDRAETPGSRRVARLAAAPGLLARASFKISSASNPR
jgi:hypothetical protein